MEPVLREPDDLTGILDACLGTGGRLVLARQVPTGINAVGFGGGVRRDKPPHAAAGNLSQPGFTMCVYRVVVSRPDGAEDLEAIDVFHDSRDLV
mmetsp:Transcript_14796/g.34383  ORF Transcript_14796/g.34383 Transcript_14796/m.34383 type:complete len:94 (+) Transcript_14796:2106-2387(+)